MSQFLGYFLSLFHVYSYQENMNICQVRFIIQESEEEITGSVSSPKKAMPYNKLLTNLACSSRTWEYWPSVVFVRTSLRSVRIASTSGLYSPVRPSRSVSKRLIKPHVFLKFKYIEKAVDNALCLLFRACESKIVAWFPTVTEGET